MNKKMIGMAVGVAVVSLGAGWMIRGLLAGGPPSMGPPQMPPAAVVAQVVLESRLELPREYIAQVEPMQSVQIRSEVSGYLKQVHFIEGSTVEAGDLLFTIDPSQYEAVVAVREAEVAQAQAEQVRAGKFIERMHGADVRSISQADLDSAESALLRADAALKQANANLNLAKIDLDYTAVKAPIRGQIGIAEVTKGNYVTSEDRLARLVQTDPVRVVFSLTDREFLTFRQAELLDAAESPVATVRLPNGTVFPTSGKKDFDDNEMNPQTGTIAVRYAFENTGGLLVAGGYVTIILQNQEAEKGIRIPQKAVLIDSQGSCVLTVDEAGVVSRQTIVSGEQIGADVVVRFGLDVGDCVVVEGVQKARPGAVVVVTLLEDEK